MSEHAPSLPPEPPEPPEPPDAPDAPLNPASVPVEQLARLLGVDEAHVRERLAQGAPVNADGTVHLVHYAAWLNRPRDDDGASG